MAEQSFDIEKNIFVLDLHGVLTADAARVVEKRINECHTFGVDQLHLVYGTPNVYDGSIARRIWRIATESPYLKRRQIPKEFLDQPDQFSARIPHVILPVRKGGYIMRDEYLSFVGFRASRERDRWKRRLCEMPFKPFKKLLTLDEVAAFAGPNYRAEHVLAALDGLQAAKVLVADERKGLLIPAERLKDIVTRVWGNHTSANMTTCSAVCEFEKMRARAVQAISSHQYADAEPIIHACLSYAQEHLSNSQVMPTALEHLAQCCFMRGRYENAETLFRTAWNWNGHHVEGWLSLRANIGSELAVLLEKQGDLEGAADVWGEVRIDRASTDEKGLELAALVKQAELRSKLRQDEKAEALYHEAYALANELNERPEVLGSLLCELGSVYARLSKSKDALSALSQASTFSKDSDPQVFEACKLAMARVRFDLHDFGKACRHLSQIVESARTRRAYGADYIAALVLWGRAELLQNRVAAAEDCFVEALEQIQKQPTADVALVWSAHYWMARTHEANGKTDKMLAHDGIAVEQISADATASPEALVTVLLRQANGYSTSGQPVAAEPLYRRALEVAERMQACEHHLAVVHHALGAHLVRHGDALQGEKHLRSAIRIYEQYKQNEELALAKLRLDLSSVLLSRSRFTEARPVCKRIIDFLESITPQTTEVRDLLAKGYSRFAAALLGLGNAKGADRMLSRAFGLRDPKHPQEDPERLVVGPCLPDIH